MTLTRFRSRPSSSELLARILDTPDLAASIQALDGPALAKLIDAVGLDDAGEIVAFARADQLAEVFDEDLWRSERAGDDERFDGDRFLVWLEVLMEAGDAFVADRLAELPEDLVTLALHQHLLVLDVDELLVEMRNMEEDDAKTVEKALSNTLSEEIGEYQLIARRHNGWDTVLAAVLALDRDHHALLVRILEHLCALTAQHVEDEGGLHTVLTSEEVLESDVAANREERRAAAGYMAPSDARAFLKLAERRISDPPREHDPVTRAYFRDLAKNTSRPPPRVSAESPALGRLLREGGVLSAPTGGTPLLAEGSPTPREPVLVRTMRRLAETDAAAFAARTEEIAYLANVLMAGASIDGRRYRPGEAVQKAVETCSRGLELASAADASPATADPVEVLRTHPAEGLFRLAWAPEP